MKKLPEMVNVEDLSEAEFLQLVDPHAILIAAATIGARPGLTTPKKCIDEAIALARELAKRQLKRRVVRAQLGEDQSNAR